MIEHRVQIPTKPNLDSAPNNQLIEHILAQPPEEISPPAQRGVEINIGQANQRFRHPKIQTSMKKGTSQTSGRHAPASKDSDKASASNPIPPMEKRGDRGKKKDKGSHAKSVKLGKEWESTLVEFCTDMGITPPRPINNDHLLLEYQRFKYASEAEWGIEVSEEEQSSNNGAHGN